MPIDITPCYQKDYLRPLKVKIEDGICRKAWLIRPGESKDRCIPPLTTDQLKYLNKFFRQEGAVGICWKKSSLYVAFENKSVYERSALGLSDYVRSDENTSVQIPAPDENKTELGLETFINITEKFLWGRMSAEKYLARFSEPSSDSTITISTALLKILPGRSQNKPGGYEYHELYLRNILVMLDSFPINDPYGWTMLANAYLHAEEAKGAIVAARWAAALNPTDLNNWYVLGSALYKYYEADPRRRRGALKEARRAFGKLVEIARGLYGRIGDISDLEQSLARRVDDDILRTRLQTLRKILETTKTDDPEGSEGGNTGPDTSTNTSSAPEGPSSTTAPPGSSSSTSKASQGSQTSQWNSQTMADVGGFDPSEQDLFSTTSTESAAILFTEISTTYPNPGANGIVQGMTVTLGAPLTTWFMAPMASRPSTLAPH